MVVGDPQNRSTGGPRYMREIGTAKRCSHIMNSHIRRPTITVNKRIGSRKKDIFESHIREFADKKTAYNEGCLYSNSPPFVPSLFVSILTSLSVSLSKWNIYI